jgi:histidinol dehydrogenase
MSMIDDGLRRSVLDIVEDVRANGDDAVLRALRTFDGCALSAAGLKVTKGEVEKAVAAVGGPVLDALDVAIRNMRSFNEEILQRAAWQTELQPGLVVGEKVTPIASAGLFVPSGKASYPSVMMQLGVPAKLAGVPTIDVAVPPRSDGSVDDAVLAAAAKR